jgi:hypothetical protein
MSRVRRAAAIAAACFASACGGLSRDDEAPRIRLFDDLGDHARPISTASPEAQRYFDQGLVLVYAFNHEAAVRSFSEAARRDPGCAICWWSVALALGPNINAAMGPDAAAEAWAAVLRARSLAAGASPLERELIEALAQRYSPDPDGADRAALDLAFANAMREVQRRTPTISTSRRSRPRRSSTSRRGATGSPRPSPSRRRARRSRCSRGSSPATRATPARTTT